MSEYPMTLDELHGACKEASDLGKPIELDALTAQAMVEDSINLSIAIERMALMLGKDPDAVNVHNMLDEFRDIMADFAALKAVVVEYCEAEKSQPSKLSSRASVEDWLTYARGRVAREALFGLIDRLEPTRSPVLEIAEVNHD